MTQAIGRVRAAVERARREQRRAEHSAADLKMRGDACMLGITQLKQRRDRSQSLLAELRRSDTLTEPSLLQEYHAQLRAREELVGHIARLQAQYVVLGADHHSTCENSASAPVAPKHAAEAAKRKHARRANPLGVSDTLGTGMHLQLQPECLRLC